MAENLRKKSPRKKNYLGSEKCIFVSKGIPCGVQKSYVTGLVSQSEQKLQQADTTLEQKLIEADTSLEQKLIQADADLESRLTAKIEQVSAQAQNQPGNLQIILLASFHQNMIV